MFFCNVSVQSKVINFTKSSFISVYKLKANVWKWNVTLNQNQRPLFYCHIQLCMFFHVLNGICSIFTRQGVRVSKPYDFFPPFQSRNDAETCTAQVHIYVFFVYGRVFYFLDVPARPLAAVIDKSFFTFAQSPSRSHYS